MYLLLLPDMIHTFDVHLQRTIYLVLDVSLYIFMIFNYALFSFKYYN